MKIAIIGGGASGLYAAVTLNKQLNNDCKITIIDHLDKCGKKILATGNGKCNFTNLNLSCDKYNHKEFVHPLIKEFDSTSLINEFKEWGLDSYSDLEGRVYPLSNSATSVLDVLRNNLTGVKIITNTLITKINRYQNRYELIGNNYHDLFDYAIVATGGKSMKVHGSIGNGYQLLQNLGHHVINVKSGLSRIDIKENIACLSGLRIKGNVIVKREDAPIFEETGEILFKDTYLSGIVIMDCSSVIFKDTTEGIIKLDLYPNKNITDLIHELKLRFNKGLNAIYSLDGLFNKMINLYLLKRCDINPNTLKLREDDINNIAETIKNLTFNYYYKPNFDNSQVSLGGIDVVEVTDEFESKINPNLYIVGEILDINGRCGGYNLHFAFASGKKAALAIKKRILNGSK